MEGPHQARLQGRISAPPRGKSGPEMVKVLKDAGICNYSIFYCNDELFGYYECEKGCCLRRKGTGRKPGR